MASKSNVPDAWDDDYEAIADSKPATTQSQQPVKVTRAERRARHAEENKALWNSAENPETFHFLDTRGTVPLKTDFKPAVKVLSRKPKPAGSAPAPSSATTLESGVGALNIQTADDDDPDSEEEARREQERNLRERQERARREREEKQRKYAEVRERLFGSPSATPDPGSGRSSPTKASANGRAPRSSRTSSRGGHRQNQGSNTSSADQSPARGSGGPRQLYDPDYTAKPNSASAQKHRSGGGGGGGVPLPIEGQPVRSPRGPDGSGRGGFGFASRGGKNTGP